MFPVLLYLRPNNNSVDDNNNNNVNSSLQFKTLFGLKFGFS